MQKQMMENVKNEFVNRYGEGSNIRAFFTPGRVNIIGEHIDYNGGFVFPCALDFGTYAVVRKRNDRKARFATMNFDLEVTVDLDNIVYDEAHDWVNYPKGVIKMYEEIGPKVPGFDVLYYGDIPNGSGLSSSASLEVLTATMINVLAGGDIAPIQLVQLSQKAENEFVGVNCGIMDQFAVGMGKEDHAILLDCNTLEYQYVPFKLDGVKIVIANTKMRRGLADSKYNERRSECEEALRDLQDVLKIDYLCDMDEATFDQHAELINNPIARNRAQHAVYENQRVLKCVDALKKGDLETVGDLLYASHDSLRDLYEVTGKELDIMVEEAKKISGVLGSRMTGAGFGGCTVSLVEDEQVDAFIKNVGENYQKRTNLEPEFYVANVGQGAYEVKGV
jgi:galactokinase